MKELIELWRERVRLLYQMEALVAENLPLAKNLSGLANGHEHCATELEKKLENEKL